MAGALAVYTVRDMKNRTQIFRSLGFIFLGYALSVIALGLERFESVAVVSEQLAYCLINAVISPVLTYGLLIFLEKSFRVTTDLTLMELVHFNHPLLRKLAEQAPGTYHHSMTLASLAETAAAAVGANEILCRVGAYFHDIGKVVKPTYFVENQKGSRNRHDKLAPRMSSLIIAAHVKDGIALAREHGLPEEVIDFIPMHHGTARMDYFYTKAMDLARNDPDETKIDEIKEQDYRYPGPRPQTKETGIMMLADAVEASVRTIEDPTPQRLEQTIEELMRKRFEEGELDECPLTVKDLTKIRSAFLGVLIGIYHTRVKYPEPPAGRRHGVPRARSRPRRNRTRPSGRPTGNEQILRRLPPPPGAREECLAQHDFVLPARHRQVCPVPRGEVDRPAGRYHRGARRGIHRDAPRGRALPPVGHPVHLVAQRVSQVHDGGGALAKEPHGRDRRPPARALAPGRPEPGRGGGDPQPV